MPHDVPSPSIEHLQERIASLELRVQGEGNRRKGERIVDQLLTVAKRLDRATSYKGSAYTVMRQLQQIDEYVDLSFGEEDHSLPASVKLELINAFEETIYRQNDQLKIIQELRPVLDSEPIRNVPSLTERMGRLSEIQVEQQKEYCQLAKETRTAIEEYNRVMQTLSQLFVQWNALVDKVESL